MPDKEPIIWQHLFESSRDYITAGVVGVMLAAIGNTWRKANGSASRVELATSQEKGREELVAAQQAIYIKIDQCTRDLRDEVSELRKESSKERHRQQLFFTDLILTHASQTHSNRKDD